MNAPSLEFWNWSNSRKDIHTAFICSCETPVDCGGATGAELAGGSDETTGFELGAELLGGSDETGGAELLGGAELGLELGCEVAIGLELLSSSTIEDSEDDDSWLDICDDELGNSDGSDERKLDGGLIELVLLEACGSFLSLKSAVVQEDKIAAASRVEIIVRVHFFILFVAFLFML